MPEMSLKDLSDAAPQGEWTIEEMPNDAGSRSNTFTSFGIEADGRTLLDTLNATGMSLEQEPDGDGGYDVWDAQGKAVIEYVLRLVRDHRANKLHDADALTQAEARGRAAGRREALEEAAKVASNDAGELYCSTSVATAERIMDAIRALIPTQPTALVSLDRTEEGR